MNKQFALKEAKERHERVLRNIEAAQKICDKVDSLLPLNWHSKFFGEDRIEFCPQHPHKASSAEFRVVCNFIETVVGKKLHRRAYGNKEQPKLVASMYSSFPNDTWVSIWVESDADETCKISFQPETTIKAIVDEHCLGISQLKE